MRDIYPDESRIAQVLVGCGEAVVGMAVEAGSWFEGEVDYRVSVFLPSSGGEVGV